MRHLTVRNVPPTLAKALEREKDRLRLSLNGTIVALLRRALGLPPEGRPKNNLGKYAGTWTEEEFREFEANTADFERIDPEEWK